MMRPPSSGLCSPGGVLRALLIVRVEPIVEVLLRGGECRERCAWMTELCGSEGVDVRLKSRSGCCGDVTARWTNRGASFLLDLVAFLIGGGTGLQGLERGAAVKEFRGGAAATCAAWDGACACWETTGARGEDGESCSKLFIAILEDPMSPVPGRAGLTGACFVAGADGGRSQWASDPD